MLTKDGKADIAWHQVTGTQFTVEDALLYDSIRINVMLPGTCSCVEDNLAYKVSKVDSNVGDSGNISWTAPFFPQAGAYIIYHTEKVNRSIIEVTSTGATFDQTKYKYHSRPYNSKNIAFEIRDITRDDAGYYNGGVSPEALWLGGGVVLIVHDKPSKPNIQGNLNILVDSYSELNCSSFLTTAPDHYARLRPLSFTWYVNNTQLDRETSKTLRFLVTRNHKYNQYSCTARDKLESNRSDPIIINPLYPPDNLTILPEPQLNQNGKLTVKEGDTIGPYTCTADCNPPCDITWEYKDSTLGGYFDVASTGLLNSQIVNRSIALYRCIAKYPPDKDFKKIESIKLDVLYTHSQQSTVEGNGSNGLSTMGRLILTVIPAVLGTVFLGVIIYFLYSRQKVANRKNDDNPTEAEVYETPISEPTYNNVNDTENHYYSEIGIKLERQSTN
uniref:Carcinoembryonic antigen-related cell adhesion molecule 6-like n=1 Tax=Crassostrea virginica TaxID=6565 RepID=A0A8B8C766_CRAVI|nr:carcinoembryonic antigen-related cell adhesion molecule 6-like [Crassostrea virginica]